MVKKILIIIIIISDGKGQTLLIKGFYDIKLIFMMTDIIMIFTYENHAGRADFLNHAGKRYLTVTGFNYLFVDIVLTGNFEK